MPEQCNRPSFLQKSVVLSGVGRVIVAQYFDRDIPVQRRLPRSKYDAHAAGAQHIEQRQARNRWPIRRPPHRAKCTDSPIECGGGLRNLTGEFESLGGTGRNDRIVAFLTRLFERDQLLDQNLACGSLAVDHIVRSARFQPSRAGFSPRLLEAIADCIDRRLFLGRDLVIFGRQIGTHTSSSSNSFFQSVRIRRTLRSIVRKTQFSRFAISSLVCPSTFHKAICRRSGSPSKLSKRRHSSAVAAASSGVGSRVSNCSRSPSPGTSAGR